MSEAFDKAKDTAPVMSMFATQEDCLKARELHFFKAGLIRAAEISENATAHTAFQSVECYQFASHISDAIRKETGE